MSSTCGRHSVAQRFPGEMEEHCLEIGLVHVDSGDRHSGLTNPREELGRVLSTAHPESVGRFRAELYEFLDRHDA